METNFGEKYIPEKGDFVWLNFDPTLGHEQAGRRPAIVLSDVDYNKTIGLAIFCPITSRIKGLPFEINCDSSKISGVILSDHIKSLDWRKRNISFIGKASQKTVNAVINNILLIINL